MFLVEIKNLTGSNILTSNQPTIVEALKQAERLLSSLAGAVEATVWHGVERVCKI